MSDIDTAATEAHSSAFAGIPVEIVNDTSLSLDVYDVYNPAGKGQTARFAYTKLGTIAANTTGSVTTIRKFALLEAMYTGTIAELQNRFCHQFPIKLMSGTQFSFEKSPPPLSYTVAEADRQSMVQSYLFHKFAMANPDSALTKKLNESLKSGKRDTINSFFAGTEGFKSCTLSSWNAVMTWLTMFTSGWQGPYYIYERPPSPLPANYAPSFLGLLQIRSTASEDRAVLTLGNLSHDSGSSLADFFKPLVGASSTTLQPLNPPQTSTVVMAGDGTMVDEAPGEDVTLTLTPIWMNVLQAADASSGSGMSYVSGPVVFGKVADKDVISQQRLLPVSKRQQKSGQADIGSQAWQWFGKLCEIAGFGVSVFMLYEVVQKWNSNKAANDEVVKGEVKDRTEYDQRRQQADRDNLGEIKKAVEDPRLTADSQAISKGYAEVSTLTQKAIIETTIDTKGAEFEANIQQQLSDGLTPTEPLQDSFIQAETDIQNVRDTLRGNDLDAARSSMSAADRSMQSTVQLGTDQMEQADVEVLSEAATAVREGAQLTEGLDAADARYQQETAEPANDSGAPTSDVTPETQDVELGSASFGE